MKANVASQLIAAQMITIADGSNTTTGTCNVAVEIDGAAGTGGTATHIANGKWEYAPIQADTNGAHITFQFVITGSITALLNVYPNFPQTVDNNVLAAGATGFAAIDTVVDAILVDTGTTIPGAIATVDSNVDAILVDTGTTIPATIATVDSNVDAILVDTGTTIPATLSTIDGIVDTILLDTNELQGDDVPGLIATLDAVVDTVKAETVLILADTADIQPNYATSTALATVDSNVDQILVDTGTTLDGKIDTIDTNVDAIKVPTDKMVFTKANELDVNTKSINDAEVVGDGNGSPWDGV